MFDFISHNLDAATFRDGRGCGSLTEHLLSMQKLPGSWCSVLLHISLSVTLDLFSQTKVLPQIVLKVNLKAVNNMT